ncbi:MAG: hypothetical protein NTZ46_05505 [Verrucomicrobia bacterium]|nr:hypothetical protein [Verrucomicrobiota bacterium]
MSPVVVTADGAIAGDDGVLAGGVDTSWANTIEVPKINAAQRGDRFNIKWSFRSGETEKENATFPKYSRFDRFAIFLYLGTFPCFRLKPVFTLAFGNENG